MTRAANAWEPRSPPDFHHPRRVFFGALDRGTLGTAERLVRVLPGGRALLPEGDFRDWDRIEAWTTAIADQLTSAPSTTHAAPLQGDS